MEKDRHIVGLENLPAKLKGGVISVGNFDGVHLGHQRIIRTMAERALGDQAVLAVTFDPPPACVAACRAPHRIRPHLQNVRRLLAAGCSHVLTIPTTQEFLNQTAEDFVRTVLRETLSPACIVEGPDFHFGRGRGGNVQTLRDVGEKDGFDVIIVEELYLPGHREKLSSSLIRDHIRRGEMQWVSHFLGAPFDYSGTVIEGLGKGRHLGFPTINLPESDQVVPENGVYAGWARVEGQRYPAAIVIGRRLMFGEDHRLIEAHLIDTEGDFYGHFAELIPLKKIRTQIKFDTPDALIAHIRKDIDTCRDILARPDATDILVALPPRE